METMQSHGLEFLFIEYKGTPQMPTACKNDLMLAKKRCNDMCVFYSCTLIFALKGSQRSHTLSGIDATISQLLKGFFVFTKYSLVF